MSALRAVLLRRRSLLPLFSSSPAVGVLYPPSVVHELRSGPGRLAGQFGLA